MARWVSPNEKRVLKNAEGRMEIADKAWKCVYERALSGDIDRDLIIHCMQMINGAIQYCWEHKCHDVVAKYGY